MKLSFNWIKDYIDLGGMPPDQLGELLTMKTCEVEGVEQYRADLLPFVVAEVRKITQHPDADKLKICTVFDGKNEVQIVTGAANVQEGKKYPMAPVGTTMPGGMKIEPAKLRGVESLGMLCSAGELQIEEYMLNIEGTHEDGLMTLPGEFAAGTPLRKALEMEDHIIEIDNKSVTHRPDLWGHYGFAREIGALLGKGCKPAPGSEPFSSDPSVDSAIGPVDCGISDNSAIGYSSAQFSGVVAGVSSFKIQSRLLGCGMRPINSVVDTSNYVMLELGQPNHPFDRSKMGARVEVAYSNGGEKLLLLGGKEVVLPEKISIIKNDNQAVALGGVMGGETTEVDLNTRHLFFESATFRREDIRRAVSKLGVRTEASQRFEKGQDPENRERAIYRFYELLKETSPELKAGTVVSVSAEEPLRNRIETTFSYIKGRLGSIDYENQKLVSILQSLGMVCTGDGDSLVVDVPVYRSYHDLTIADDLVEEIGRVIGYREIERKPFMVSCEVPQYSNSLRKLEHRLRDVMSMVYHYTEVYNYAFHSLKEVDSDKRFADRAVELENAVHNELPFLRISPLPGLLKNISEYNREYSSLKLFEMERIFIPRSGEKDEGSLPEERYFLAGVHYNDNIESPEEMVLSLISVLSDLMGRLGIDQDKLSFEPFNENSGILHPGRKGKVKSPFPGCEIIWGEVHPKLLRDYDIAKKVYYFELFLHPFLDPFVKEQSTYKQPYRFPSTDFEFTVLADEKTLFQKIVECVGKPGSISENGILTESVEYLTTYRGEQIPVGKKAVSVRLRWRNPEGTLGHEQIKDLQEKTLSSLSSSGFTLR